MVGGISGSGPVNYPQGQNPLQQQLDQQAKLLLTQEEEIKNELVTINNEIGATTDPKVKAALTEKWTNLEEVEIDIASVAGDIAIYSQRANPSNLQGIKSALPALQKDFSALSPEDQSQYSQIQTSINALNKIINS